MTRDSRIDDYIARQAPFAQPILNHLREVVHATSPDIEESIKWGMPAFNYSGKGLATMAGFKAHATFALWHGKEAIGEAGKAGAMGQFGRLTEVGDLPDRAALEAMVKAAAAQIKAGAPRRAKTSAKPPLEAPADLNAALDAAPTARATFDAFPPGCRREYIEWIVEAKRPETRAKRLAQAVEWMTEGKKRNWKYEQC